MNIIKIVGLVLFAFAFAVNFPCIATIVIAIHVVVGIVSFAIFRKRLVHRRRWNSADTVTLIAFAGFGLLSPIALRRI
mgnify:CR=1 FL=1